MLKFKPYLLLAVFTFLILLTLSVVFSAQLLRWYIPYYFDDLGVKAQVGELDIGLLDGRLTVNDFTTIASDQRRLSFEQFSLDWQWQGLLDRQVQINAVSLNGLTLDVISNTDAVIGVGSLELARLLTDEAAPSTPSRLWQVSVGPLKLVDIELCHHEVSRDQFDCMSAATLKLDSQLNLSSQQPPQWQGDLSIEKLRIGTYLDLASAKLVGAQWRNNDLALEQLTVSPFVSTFGAHQLQSAGFELTGLTLKQLSQLQLQHSGFKPLELTQSSLPLLTLASLNLDSIQANLTQPSIEVGNSSLEDLTIWQASSRGKQDKLLKLKQLLIGAGKANQQQQQINQIKLSQLGLMQDLHAPAEQMLVRLPTATLEQLNVGERVQLRQLVLTELVADLVFDQQGLNLAQWLDTPEGSAQAPSNNNNQAVIIDELNLLNSQVNITEHSLGEAKLHQLTELELTLANIQLFAEPQPLDIKLTTRLNQGGTLQAQGQFEADSMTKLKGKIEHLSLPDYSAYAARHLGYRIDQGQLNSDFAVDINANLIDSEFKLQLNKFELGQLQQHEQNPADQQLGLPLPMALNLLRDSDNNIRLNIPVKGDLNSPDFSLADVVSTVGFKALKSAVLYAYSPLGFVAVTSGVIDLATAMRFKPVVFAPGQTDLNQAHKQRLDKLISLLTNKPKVTLVLCATATKKDWLAEQPFTEQQLQSLLQLANKRQQNARQYVVEKGQIAPSRLLLCNVKMATDDNQNPQLNLSF